MPETRIPLKEGRTQHFLVKNRYAADASHVVGGIIAST